MSRSPSAVCPCPSAQATSTRRSPNTPAGGASARRSSALRIVNSHHAGLTQAELRLADKTSAVVDEHDEAERALPSRAA